MSTPRPEPTPISFAPLADPPADSAPPVDSSSASAIRVAFARAPGASRSAAGSPLNDMAASRLPSRSRAREIQAQEGVQRPFAFPWAAPPTSGNSTPLRENIPESPTDGFSYPAVPLPASEGLPAQIRRGRAGTMPSRFPSNGIGNGPTSMNAAAALNARMQAYVPSYKADPLQASKETLLPSKDLLQADEPSPAGTSTLLSRLRAGSMPQRSPFASGSSTPFGPSLFNTGGVPVRERGMTLQSIASQPSNDPSSPAQSTWGSGDNEVYRRALDFAGQIEPPLELRVPASYLPVTSDAARAARLRSYSVNYTDKYPHEEDYASDSYDASLYSKEYLQHVQGQLDATQAAIDSHNLAMQAALAHATRPRARTTTGVLDPRVIQMLPLPPGQAALRNPLAQAEGRLPDDKAFDELTPGLANMFLSRSNSRNNGLLNPDDIALEGPTSALWLGSIPTSTTISTLTEMFKAFGAIASARVLTHKNCGFVNFERIESAVAARASLNGKEIFPGAGPVRINFAKPPSTSNTPVPDGTFPSPSPDPFSKGQDSTAQGAAAAGGPAPAVVSPDKVPSPTQPADGPPTVPPVREMAGDLLRIMQELGATDDECARIAKNVESAITYDGFIDEIPPISESAHTRAYDAPSLRDIRKRIDNEMLSQAEIENISVDMLPEVAELSSDYLGNTVVQKLFEHCSDPHRDAMLERIAPHLAVIGVHKNGTWAAQKIIDVCQTPSQKQVIADHLRPYAIPLFLDQYGNYVLQACLRFGPPYNNFVFESMVSRMWEIAQGRFGARAMRACLESHRTNKDQQRMLAAAIALHSVQLATDANGALLLTWFLDTCTFPRRRTVLAPLLVPHLVHLCTHKLAYLTVLKVINQKTEPDARDTMLQALFLAPENRVLEAILSDHSSGATLIYKVITTPFSDTNLHGQIVETVKAVLLRINAQPGQGYKRLMDEVGLSTRTNGGSRDRDHGNGGNHSNHNNNGQGEPRQRPASRQSGHHHHHHQQQHHHNRQFFNGPSNQAANAANYDMAYGVPRSDGADPNLPPFHSHYPGPQAPMYSAPGTPAGPAMGVQQYQYQQTFMNRNLPPVGNFYQPMQVGYGGFGSPNGSMDNFRPSPNIGSNSHTPTLAAQMPAHAPLEMLAQMSGGPPGFAPPGFNMGMNTAVPGYQFGNVPGAQNMGYAHPQQTPEHGGRRGRR